MHTDMHASSRLRTHALLARRTRFSGREGRRAVYVEYVGRLHRYKRRPGRCGAFCGLRGRGSRQEPRRWTGWTGIRGPGRAALDRSVFGLEGDPNDQPPAGTCRRSAREGVGTTPESPPALQRTGREDWPPPVSRRQNARAGGGRAPIQVRRRPRLGPSSDLRLPGADTPEHMHPQISDI